MTCHVFTYGSLMFPEVWGRVVRGEYRSEAARLQGYARFEIKDETYPGMIVLRGAEVAGVLYLDVGAADLAALDHFEGDEYRRENVRVALASGETVEAATYVYLRPEKLSKSTWLPEAFEMTRFLGSYCREKLGE